MGAAAAGGGEFFGNMMRGYMASRQQGLENRMQQVNQLSQQAQQLFEASERMRESGDADSAQLLKQGYANAMDQRDKLAGEKGQGTWKAVKHLFGHNDPAPAGPNALPPPPMEAGPTSTSVPFNMASGAEPQSVATGQSGPAPFMKTDAGNFAVGAGQPQTVTTPPGEEGGGYRNISLPGGETQGIQPPGDGANLPPTSWAQRFANAPTVTPQMQRQQQAQRAYSGLNDIASKFHNRQEMLSSPEFWKSMSQNAGDLAALGQDPQKVYGEMTDMRFPNTVTVDPNSEMGKVLYTKGGLAPGTPVPMTEWAHALSALPKAQEALTERLATLATGLSSGTIPRGGRQEEEYETLKGLSDPNANRTYQEQWSQAYISKYGPGTKANMTVGDARMKAINDWFSAQSNVGKDKYGSMVGQDGYAYRMDLTNGTMDRIVDSKTKQPVYVGLHGSQGALINNQEKEGSLVRPRFNPIELGRELDAGFDPEMLFQSMSKSITPMRESVNQLGKPSGKQETNPTYQELVKAFQERGYNPPTPGIPPIMRPSGGAAPGAAGATAPSKPTTTWPPG